MGRHKSHDSTICHKVLCKKSHGDVTDRLAYLYFDSRKGLPGDSAGCLRSLIAQLSKSAGDLPIAVQNLFDRHSLSGQAPDRFDLREVLLSVIRRQQRTFIIIDALDQTFKKDEVLEILCLMAEKHPEDLHLLVASRLERHIKQRLDSIAAVTVHVGGHKFDERLPLYVQDHIRDDPKMSEWEDELKIKVEVALIEGADERYSTKLESLILPCY